MPSDPAYDSLSDSDSESDSGSSPNVVKVAIDDLPPPPPVARAVLSGEDDTKRSSTLEEICVSRRADLEAAEVELAKHRSQIAEYVIPDEAELNALQLGTREANGAARVPLLARLYQ